MRGNSTPKTVVLFFGLPYSGKTALIETLSESVPGESIYVDSLFKDIVPANEICLDRWLSAQPDFVGLIANEVMGSENPIVYVELGIFQREFRAELMARLSNEGYRLIPLSISCNSKDEINKRQAARQRALDRSPEKAKIAIGLDELYERIVPVFEDPEPGEQMHVIDTTKSISTNLHEITTLISH